MHLTKLVVYLSAGPVYTTQTVPGCIYLHQQAAVAIRSPSMHLLAETNAEFTTCTLTIPYYILYALL